MQCVVLAAGEGMRMRPLTSHRPKVMVPVANRPLLEHLLCAIRDAGIREVLIVVGYCEESIRRYFGDGSRLGLSISYISQRRQRGTADALSTVEEAVHGRFLVMNGDMILKADDIAEFTGRTQPCMGVCRHDHPEEYGRVTVSGDTVTSMKEKSTCMSGNLINAGIYLFDEGIFEILDNLHPSARGELELSDALGEYIANGELTAHYIDSWMDVGRPWDLLDANAAILQDMDHRILGEVESGASVGEDVSIGEGTVVRTGTVIEGPAAIGRNCRIGPHAYIRDATSIGDGCHIGHATEIKNSVIMENTNCPHFNYIGDSVIGAGCNIGAGTKVANLRHDRAEIRVGGVNTHRRKFGAIIGDGVRLGINCSVNTGTIIGPDVQVAPHTLLKGLIADSSRIQ
ncbi:MAG: bifunctional sugar-1-phosphate nucleotidylyltransferase/acetyltransferase [Methanoculleaceae archaeon]